MAVIGSERGTVIGIVNEVQRRLGYSTTTTLSANRTALLLKDFLNDTLSYVSDEGDWPQMYEEIIVSAPASALNIEVNSSAPVKRIYEVHEDTQISPLYPRSIEDIRRLERTSAFGTPRQYALVNTSGINPILRIYPRTNTSTVFNIAAYTAPLIHVSGDEAVVPPFSSRLLVNGVYAAALLDEAGGQPSQQYQAQFALFQRQLREERNRNTTDLGTDVYLIPARE